MIKIRDLCVDLGQFLLQDVNLDIEEGEYFVVLGPTGAGKTVLLEAIAGLYPVRSGRIWLDDEEITGLGPERRGIGFAYQDYALFPHLSVRDNVGFGLRQRGHRKGEIRTRVDELAELIGISRLLDRRPGTLSGGESQKVVLARALATRPRLLLLDEPLSAMDPLTREELQRELRGIHERFRITTVHVTHDFEEAIAMGDRIAVLGEGRVVQVGTAEEVFRRPNSEFVARFSLAQNIFMVKVEEGQNGLGIISFGDTRISTSSERRGALHASLRPEDILISTEPLHSSALNSLPGTISEVSDRGSTVYLTVSVPPDFVCLITRRSFEEMELRRGMQVFITFKASAVHIF
jgi:molybdopterin-binding protein